MLISSFDVQNYKGFREKQTVKFTPLTLLYGENSSGKSALLRLLPWISESMADDRPGPILDGVVGREALWSDLAHISTSTRPIEITVEWATSHKATWSFRGGVLPGSCELKKITLEAQKKVWELEDDGDGKWQGRIDGVKGLLPCDRIDVWHQAISSERCNFALNVQWLQAIRVAIPRVEKGLASPPGRLASNGDGVARFLYHWTRNGSTDSEKLANAFVLDFFHQLKFELSVPDVAPSFFRLDVAPLGISSPSINLIDTGEGLTQVLAPLVAMARAAYNLGPRVVCIEQPELHLHTDAQRALARSIAKAISAGAQIIIETHSEVLLAAIQLAIATRPAQISAEKVSLYWVERRGELGSMAKRVEFDERGRISGGWPIDAFDDLLQLKGELLQAQRSAQ